MTEETQELNPSGSTPAEQGSVVPLRWKPTVAEPVPVVRCVQIKKDGNRCNRWSYRGSSKCVRHLGNGGKLNNVKEHADAVVEAARLRLLDDADLALDTLFELIQPGTSEGIRLKASTEILDRAGIKGGFDINVDVQVTQNPSEEISKRLEKLARGAAHVAEMRERARREAAEAEQQEANTVEAEVVEDVD